MRTFSQFPLKIWRDRQFRQLTDDAKLALLSLWCGPQSTSSGVMRLEDGYGAMALDWTVERWQAARTDIERHGFIKHDADTDEILIVNFFSTNRPANERARIAVTKQILAVESPELQDEARQAFESVCTPPLTQAPSRLHTAYLNGTRKAVS